MPEPTQKEIQDWLREFIINRSRAFYLIPNHVYAHLRSEGLLDAENDLSEHARSIAHV